jgi:hypothetical protein
MKQTTLVQEYLIRLVDGVIVSGQTTSQVAILDDNDVIIARGETMLSPMSDEQLKMLARLNKHNVCKYQNPGETCETWVPEALRPKVAKV